LYFKILYKYPTATDVNIKIVIVPTFLTIVKLAVKQLWEIAFGNPVNINAFIYNVNYFGFYTYDEKIKVENNNI
jgi:hypothetical protein